MTQPEDHLTPHPDRILDEVSNVINQSAKQEEMRQALEEHVVVLAVVHYIRTSLVKAGISDEVADEMVMTWWQHRFAPPILEWWNEPDES